MYTYTYIYISWHVWWFFFDVFAGTMEQTTHHIVPNTVPPFFTGTGPANRQGFHGVRPSRSIWPTVQIQITRSGTFWPTPKCRQFPFFFGKSIMVKHEFPLIYGKRMPCWSSKAISLCIYILYMHSHNRCMKIEIHAWACVWFASVHVYLNWLVYGIRF